MLMINVFLHNRDHFITMAMMDDRAFLVSHIRNSFITSDDTGMCDLIIDVDGGLQKQATGVEIRPFTWHPG